MTAASAGDVLGSSTSTGTDVPVDACTGDVFIEDSIDVPRPAGTGDSHASSLMQLARQRFSGTAFKSTSRLVGPLRLKLTRRQRRR